MTDHEAYRATLAARIERNRRRLLYWQDGRGHVLTWTQARLLEHAIRADDRDWAESHEAEWRGYIAGRGLL
jgi:hypothetical protein